MATYTERAILELVDKATGPAKQINAALRSIDATARRLNSINLNPRAGGLTSLVSEARKTANALGTLERRMQALSSRQMNVPALSGVGQFVAQLNTLSQAMTRFNAQAAQMRSSMRLPALQPPSAQGRLPGPASSSWLPNRSGFNPNAGLIDRAQNRAVSGAENALKSGIDSSQAARDYARQLFPKEPEVTAKAEKFATDLTKTYKSMAVGDIMRVWLETAAQAKNPLDPAIDAMVKEQLATGLQAQMHGQDRKKATDSLFRIAKAANLRGDMTDSSGELDPESFRKFSESIRKAQNVAGKDLPPEAIFQAVKYARTSRGTINYEMLTQLLLAGADIGGSSAGVGQQSFINQMMGQATKEAQAVQAKYGLVKGEMKKSTPSGPQKFAYESTADSEALYENNRLWIYDKFMKPGGVLSQMGLDPMKSSPAQIAAATKPMYSNRVAHDWLVYQITQFQENANLAARGDKSAFEAGAILGNADSSMRVKMMAVGAQLESAFGELANKLQNAINPLLDIVSGATSKLTVTGQPLSGKELAVTGATAGLGGLGLYGIYRALSGSPLGRNLPGGALLGAAGSVAAGVGLSQVIGKVAPGTELQVAAGTLLAAGVALNGAAVSLGGKGMLPGALGAAAASGKGLANRLGGPLGIGMLGLTGYGIYEAAKSGDYKGAGLNAAGAAAVLSGIPGASAVVTTAGILQALYAMSNEPSRDAAERVAKAADDAAAARAQNSMSRVLSSEAGVSPLDRMKAAAQMRADDAWKVTDETEKRVKTLIAQSLTDPKGITPADGFGYSPTDPRNANANPAAGFDFSAAMSEAMQRSEGAASMFDGAANTIQGAAGQIEAGGISVSDGASGIAAAADSLLAVGPTIQAAHEAGAQAVASAITSALAAGVNVSINNQGGSNTGTNQGKVR